MVATLRHRRLIRTGPGQSGANVTTESLKYRRHAASADGPYLLGAPKASPPADAGAADANTGPPYLLPTSLSTAPATATDANVTTTA